MRVRTIIYLVVALLIAVFIGVNWGVMLRSTPIDFVFTEITAPLGFLILVIAVLIAFIALLGHVLARLAWRQERRGLAQELARQRQRADQVEQSRVQELRDFLAQETRIIREQLDRVLANLSRH